MMDPTLVEKELRAAVDKNNLPGLEAILARPEVKAEVQGQREWSFPGGAPLQSAAYYGRDDMVLALMDAGVHVNSIASGSGYIDVTALHLAVPGNTASTIRLLLKIGADRTLVGIGGGNAEAKGTPLEWATQLDRTEIVQILNDYNPPAAATRKRVSLKSVIETVETKAAMEEELSVATRIMTELTAKRSKLATLQTDITTLEEDPGYRSLADINSLKETLEEMEKLGAAFQKMGAAAKPPAEDDYKSDLKSCTVCLKHLGKIFMCMECFSFICEDCNAVLNTCPTCRADRFASLGV